MTFPTGPMEFVRDHDPAIPMGPGEVLVGDGSGKMKICREIPREPEPPMKVKDLLEMLQRFDPETVVEIYDREYHEGRVLEIYRVGDEGPVSIDIF